MAVRPILLFPDPRLSQPCKTIDHFGAALEPRIIDLLDTLKASPGVGLAGPQIGISERISVIDVTRAVRKKRAEPLVSHGLLILVNPVLLEGRGVQIPREGCLSVPDWLANVRRYQEVTVKAQDPQGNDRIIKSHGFEALALQHEIDHLHGKLFLDRVLNLKTDVFRRKGYG